MLSNSPTEQIDTKTEENFGGKPVPLKNRSLEEVVNKIEDIATLPLVAIKVIEIANNPKSGAADLKMALESDASLSAKVLRLANSVAYSPRMKITNLIHAISYLGFRQIRNLALTASVREIFQSSEKVGTYDQNELWRHLVSVAIGARMIAIRKEFQDFEDAYLAGLLHDLGIILEDQNVTAPFQNLMKNLDEAQTLPDQEDVILGFNHTTLGVLVGERWKFPSSVQAAIGFHHMSENYMGPDKMILYCVELANFICSLKEITSVGVNLVTPPLFAIKALSFEKEDIKILGNDLEDEMKLQQDLYTIS